MSRRAAFLDRSIGETRAVVTLDGRPERLLVRRDDEAEGLRLGARSAARVTRVERGLGAVFLALADGEAMAAAGPRPPAEGAAVEIEITAEARAGKSASAAILGAAQGEPRMLAAAPSPEALLAGWAPGAAIATGEEAARLADEAQDEALQTIHALPGGGSLAIETTRALTAVDIDVGERRGSDARRLARQTNLAAIAEAARLLRLKGLGGLVVIDLAGKGHDGPAMAAAAREAFAPDMPGVGVGPISRFGLFELALPWRLTPLADRLCAAPGVPTARTRAQALLRAALREAQLNPGARLVAVCSSDLAGAASPWLPVLTGRIGERFSLEVRDGLAGGFAVRAL